MKASAAPPRIRVQDLASKEAKPAAMIVVEKDQRLPALDMTAPDFSWSSQTSEASKYENKNPLHRFLLNRFLSSITRGVLSTGRRDIVEIGCADGYVYEFLRDHAGVPLNYADFDIDLIALESAKKGSRAFRSSGEAFMTSRQARVLFLASRSSNI
jgi:hypothetical protein